MTASRAHRRGPSPSLAVDSPASAGGVPTRAPEVRPADDRKPEGRARPTEGATGAVTLASPLTPAAPVIPVISMSRAHLLRTTVPAHPSRASGVRAMVAEHLTHLGLSPERLDNAVLATDELFANALRHGSPHPGGTITVSVECAERQLRVTVADRSCALPRRRTADEAEESGRGLAIVAALADDWGIAPPDPGTTGKQVWFTLVLEGMP